MKKRRTLPFLFTMLATVMLIAQVSANTAGINPVVTAAHNFQIAMLSKS